MKTSSGYHRVKVGKISDAKLKKALKGGSLSLTPAELRPNDFDLLLHPANAKKVLAAQKANKGTRIDITHGEAEHNNSELQGGSIFSGIWNFLKNNATPLLDIVKNVATPFVGEDVANAGRSLVQSMTGKGFPKGSQAAKDHMAKLRAMRKTKTVGGSFRLS
ncbi:hypothetical protein DYB25_006426 [Aphanomyces astaci]|uniref:Uncharacterized protein n=1 Tax=Aphanomyces astaci TaxID=112090 RepID=A0A397BSE6_APHAT|nr:hypothetical protein DYB25_006426 [Aphanomyces astaci]RHY55185.1 hypothetical protein DYB30_008377 [Aphanomyces astaci]RHY74550.1 hypothetical protein DYB34_013721 [Aphanomyces astaci]RHY78189.1 hypothetical protein DYB38_006625 [Aphanomyces astaci]RHY89407.1 hypothetical protein DYB31_003114 [Aphanomyces astaci]